MSANFIPHILSSLDIAFIIWVFLGYNLLQGILITDTKIRFQKFLWINILSLHFFLFL